MMNRYKHIVFDIDGTLLDTEQVLMRALQETVQMVQHRQVELDELAFAWGIPGEVTLKRLGVEDPQRVYQLWVSMLSKYFHTIKLFDGVIPLLDRLTAEGYILGIITSKTHQEFAHDLMPFGITHYFKTIICANDAPRPKPDPDPMLTYLDRTAISAHQALYIGDTAYDRQCAKDAGVDFGLAVWGCHSKDSIKADYYFNTPQEVIRMLEKEF